MKGPGEAGRDARLAFTPAAVSLPCCWRYGEGREGGLELTPLNRGALF
jgi:hypothetical protein